MQFQLKKKQKIGLNIYHKLRFEIMKNKNTFEFFIKNKIVSIDLLKEISKKKKIPKIK